LQTLRGSIGSLARACGAVALAVTSMMAEGPAASAQVEPFVAGVVPDRRPDSAPRITTIDRPADWQVKAHAGIATPPPPLSFLKDQGGWYTPFTLPGMPGPYDIRGLHVRGEPAGPSPAEGSPAASKIP